MVTAASRANGVVRRSWRPIVRTVVTVTTGKTTLATTACAVSMTPAGCAPARPLLSAVAMTTLGRCPGWPKPTSGRGLTCSSYGAHSGPFWLPGERLRTGIRALEFLAGSWFAQENLASLQLASGADCPHLLEGDCHKGPGTTAVPRERTVGPASSRVALQPDEALQAFGNASIRGQVSCLLPFSLQLHPLLSPSDHRFPYPVHPTTISTLPCPRCALLNIPASPPLCHLWATYFRFPTAGLCMAAHFSLSSLAVTMKIFPFSPLLQARCLG